MSETETQIIPAQPSSLALDAMTTKDVVAQVQLIQHVMSAVMKEKEHYGVIPGTGNKPSLLKPGAEKLGFVFRLVPRFEVTLRDMGEGHREYEIICNLEQVHTGRFFGSGVGTCSTLESKYRYRSEVLTDADGNPHPVPSVYWKNRNHDLLGGPQFSAKKQDGQWVIAHRVEHTDPADYYNTCLKMAKKRAHVDAILTATAASDIFTQDVEDMVDDKGASTVAKPIAKQAATPGTLTPQETKIQGVLKSWEYTDKNDPKKVWYKGEINGRNLWTLKSDVGQEMLEANGLEVVLTAKSGTKPNVYQVLAVDVPDKLETVQAAVTDNAPDDIPF
jgi:hypothetical protein